MIFEEFARHPDLAWVSNYSGSFRDFRLRMSFVASLRTGGGIQLVKRISSVNLVHPISSLPRPEVVIRVLASKCSGTISIETIY